MASVRKRKRKDGSMFYEIQVSRGRGLSPYTMRWDRPEGLAERTIQSQLKTVAVNFENDCKAGKVKTRKEEKEAAELERKEREKAEKDRVTFRRFCNESFLPAIRARASQTSAYNYELQIKKHIFPAIGEMEMTLIRAGDINQLLRQILAEGKSDAVAVKTYTIIRSVMKMAYKDEIIERNPMERVDRPHKRKQNGEAGDVKSCTAEELKRLCEALREEPYLWQVLVRLLIDSGMRIGECVGLLWENLNFEKNVICVNGALKYTPDKGIVRSTTKNGKSRSFGVDPEVMEMLRVLRDRQGFSRESAYVFVNEKTGLPLHPDSPRRFIKQLGEKCGIKGLHPHMLRHSFASVAITNGADIASVSEKLGHSDKAVTLRMYTHADEASIPYRKATLLLENNAFDEATEAFTALGDYKDSKEIVADIPYQQACYFAENSMDDEALEAFAKLGDYKDSLTKIKDITYSKGCALLREKSYQEAYDVFCSLGDYRDSNELAEKAKKEIAQLLEEKKTTSMSEKSKLSLSKLWDGNYLDYDYDPVEKVFKPSGVFSTYCEWTINVKDNNVIQRYTKNDFGQDQSWSVSYSIISIDSQYATIKDIVGENILLYRNDGKIFINFPQNDSAEYNAYLVKKS